jgi:flagellar biosynthetic protein FliR
MPDLSVASFQLFLLVLFRILAMCQVAPLISSSAIPMTARVGFSFVTAVAVFPWVQSLGYAIPDRFADYFLLMVGEALVGILLGFFQVIIFSAFQMAGQYFSLQMGFGASEVFDPLAQIEIPLMGQLLNLMAMFIFLAIGGFQKFVLIGLMRSFQAIRAADLALRREYLFGVLLRSLSGLFEQALTISFPFLGSLLLVSVSMGLMAKAAPQVNLLVMGFPISIAVALVILILCMPFLVEAFAGVIDGTFSSMGRIFLDLEAAR